MSKVAVDVRRTLACAAAAGWLLAACVPVVHTDDGRRLRATTAEFRDYAAAVFRRQNAATVAVADSIADSMDATAVDDPAAVAALERAEARMLDACDALNVLAVARRDGSGLSRSALLDVADSVAPCDAATRHVESLLERAR